jgi:hypothetical protein
MAHVAFTGKRLERSLAVPGGHIHGPAGMSTSHPHVPSDLQHLDCQTGMHTLLLHVDSVHMGVPASWLPVAQAPATQASPAPWQS